MKKNLLFLFELHWIQDINWNNNKKNFYSRKKLFKREKVNEFQFFATTTQKQQTHEARSSVVFLFYLKRRNYYLYPLKFTIYIYTFISLNDRHSNIMLFWFCSPKWRWRWRWWWQKREWKYYFDYIFFVLRKVKENIDLAKKREKKRYFYYYFYSKQ